MLQIEDFEIILNDLEGRLLETSRNNNRIPGSKTIALSFLRSEFEALISVVNVLEERCSLDYSKFGRYQNNITKILMLIINRLRNLQPLLESKTMKSKIYMGRLGCEKL